jgi:hypothetical protein
MLILNWWVYLITFFWPCNKREIKEKRRHPPPDLNKRKKRVDRKKRDIIYSWDDAMEELKIVCKSMWMSTAAKHKNWML